MIKKALIVYEDSFDDPKLDTLIAPESDAIKLKGLLLSKHVGFQNENIFLLGPGFGLTDFQKTFQSFCEKSEEDDFLFFYYAGHGNRDSNKKLHLAIRKTSIASLAASSINITFMKEMLKNATAKRKLVILDCCHAAAYYNDDDLRSRAAQDDEEVYREQFDGSGTYILAASRAEKLAYESDDESGKPYSLYLKKFIEAIETGDAAPEERTISVESIHKYIYNDKQFGDKLCPILLPPAEIRTGMTFCDNPKPRLPIEKGIIFDLSSSEVKERELAVLKLDEIIKSGPPHQREKAKEEIAKRLKEPNSEPLHKIRKLIKEALKKDGEIKREEPETFRWLKKLRKTIYRALVFALASLSCYLIAGTAAFYIQVSLISKEIDPSLDNLGKFLIFSPLNQWPVYVSLSPEFKELRANLMAASPGLLDVENSLRAIADISGVDVATDFSYIQPEFRKQLLASVDGQSKAVLILFIEHPTNEFLRFLVRQISDPDLLADASVLEVEPSENRRSANFYIVGSILRAGPNEAVITSVRREIGILFHQRDDIGAVVSSISYLTVSRQLQHQYNIFISRENATDQPEFQVSIDEDGLYGRKTKNALKDLFEHNCPKQDYSPPDYFSSVMLLQLDSFDFRRITRDIETTIVELKNCAISS